MTKATEYRLQRMSSLLRHRELNFDNLIIHSRLSHFEKSVKDSGLSIKLGHAGEEHYLFGQHKHTIRPGRYLLVNRHRAFDCYLNSKEPVEAFCIYLGKDAIREAWRSLHQHTGQLLDQGAEGTVPPPPTFLEKVYHTRENELGLFLESIRPLLLTPQPLDYDALFYTLAEKLLRSQCQAEQQIRQISAVRRSTREELYRRLSIAHYYILDNFRNDIQLNKLAREAALSKYHLLRTYKEAFGITPYRQVLDLRLDAAKELLKKGYPLSEIACQLGFSDRRSFTKAFKKTYGSAPSFYKD